MASHPHKALHPYGLEWARTGAEGVQTLSGAVPACLPAGTESVGGSGSPPAPALLLAEQGLQEEAHGVNKPGNDNTKDGKNREHGNPLAVKWRLAPTRRLV